MRKSILALLPLLLLVACNKAGGYRGYASDRVSAEAAAAPEAAAAASTGGPAMPPPAGAPMLAYDYSATLSVPDGRVPGLLARHQQACAAAGSNLCQMLGSNVSTDRGTTTGTLRLRAEPRWLARFRAGLAQDAKGAGGSLTRSSVESQDLTRSIVDTEAMLRAKTTLRDRLQQLLASHPGKVGDLLEIEKQLAEVQGEIDAAQSELAAVRGRVDMSTLTLRYEARSQFISAKAARPLGEAVRGFFGVVMVGAAAILYVTAFLIPFAIVIVPLVWWLRRRHLRRKAARPPES